MDLLKNREAKLFSCILLISAFMVISFLYILNTSNPPSSQIKNHQETFLINPSATLDQNVTNIPSFNNILKNLLSINLVPRTPHFPSIIISTKLDQYRNYTNQDLACKPKIYGYSPEQVSYFFKPREFSDCNNRSNPITKIINNTLELQCPFGSGEYLASYGREYEFFGRYTFKANWIQFNSKILVDLEDKEFAMIKCSNNIKQAFLKCKFLPDAYKRAKEISEKIAEDVGTNDYKPLGVHIIVLDSVSRQHFYRNFPRTVDYLNERVSGSEDLAMYDFMINSVQGKNTRPNLVAMLFGRRFSDHIQDIEKFSQNETMNDENFKRLQEERALWKYYEKLGYVTFFGFETMWKVFSEDTGKYVYADHKVLSFWNAAKTVFGFSDYIKTQRCFGTKDAHRYLFDYLHQFVQVYKGVNKFSYMHFPEAHEDTGTVIRLVDKDYKETLDNVINAYSSTQEDFVIILASDHGRGVTEWDSSDEGFFENTSSLQILITKQDLIQRMGPKTHEILTHNTNRIASKFDWYVSYLHLALFPYGNLPINSQTYKNIKSSTPTNKTLSLFLEKIPNERTCADMLIPNYLCQCRDFEPLDINSEIIQKLAIPLINDTIGYINEFYNDDVLCKKLIFEDVVEANDYRLKDDMDGANRKIKVVVRVKNNTSARIEFLMYSANKDEFKRLNIKFSNHTTDDMEIIGMYGPINIRMQVMSYKRVDLYNCGDLDSTRAINGICVCNDN